MLEPIVISLLNSLFVLWREIPLNYTNLESGLIDNWEQLECKFFNHFYSTHRVISMIELTNVHQ
jgi:hypothetical protein